MARTLRFAYGIVGPVRQNNLYVCLFLSQLEKLIHVLCRDVLTSDGEPRQTHNLARPPPYSPPLHAVLSSQLTRIKHGTRVQPNKPTLLSLALERRGWLGKLPERREKNIWWRWWREEPTKVFAPVEIELNEGLAENIVPPPSAQTGEETLPQNNTNARPSLGPTSMATAIQRLGLPMLKTQDSGLVRRAEEYAASRRVPHAPRRSSERIKPTARPELTKRIGTPPPPQPRSVRRSYLDLLSRLPILSFVSAKPSPSQPAVLTANPTSRDLQSASSVPTAPGKFTVRLSPLAPIRGAPRSRVTYSRMSKEDHEWILRSQELPKERRSP